MGEMEDLEVVECTRCPGLAECRSRIVNGVGPADADLLFVGEGPGANEDDQGEPFVGRSGTVLDDALRTAGLARADVRITNCVRCRPPDNRDPRREELANCREYLDREIDAVDPTVIVTLGKVPSEHLLDRDVAVTGEAGDTFDCPIAGETRTVMVSVHPAATLYDRSQETTFEGTIQRAADLTGAGGQSTLGSF
ncbi:uracil-DNA glycosylase [Halorientalis regularis]|jgi:uracil-DNA glycosylase family 4|uniref:Type-4 uracil-DNA glycosylase n=1 Tax=Halorientalis regularis TaxID=660518 RepID=A0A1G7L5I4_9EURY|nr:uracil-DNA glycosylase [Halorientalis regularis]SDF44792.1 DNA polymerase [Halorientalis regularis]